MAAGQISDKNTRIAVTIPKDLKFEAEVIATKENRSLSNLIVTLLSKYVAENK
jgi:metal-responsive CopG/Arc/MetJ family transcriptional regulator